MSAFSQFLFEKLHGKQIKPVKAKTDDMADTFTFAARTAAEEAKRLHHERIMEALSAKQLMAASPHNQQHRQPALPPLYDSYLVNLSINQSVSPSMRRDTEAIITMRVGAGDLQILQNWIMAQQQTHPGPHVSKGERESLTEITTTQKIALAEKILKEKPDEPE